MFLFAKEGDADSKIASTTLELAKKIKWLLWLMTQMMQLCCYITERKISNTYFL